MWWNKDQNNKIDKAQVKKVLSKVNDPELRQDLVSLNMVKVIRVDNNDVFVEVELTTSGCPLKAKIEGDCQNAIRSIDGVGKIEIKLTAKPKMNKIEVQLSNVKYIVLISSGKGGVGKTTVAVNLARVFAQKYRVGLMDGDIYGPNVNRLLNNDKKLALNENKKIIPNEQDNIKFVSMGLLIGRKDPLVWRGPMLHGVVKQFLTEVEWGDLDYLFIDLPPGTGDVHLSLCQMVDVTGAVIVTTPQELSVEDVRKGIAMFRKLQVPILGIVENMSFYIHPGTNEVVHMFGKGGGQNLANEWNIPFLMQIPIDPEIYYDRKKGMHYLKNLVDRLDEIVRNCE